MYLEIIALDFEFNGIFKIFKHQRYATLLLARPGNITDYLINLIISSKETGSSFSCDFSSFAVFSVIAHSLHIGPKISLVFDCTVSNSLSVKGSCLHFTILGRELSKTIHESKFFGTLLVLY